MEEINNAYLSRGIFLVLLFEKHFQIKHFHFTIYVQEKLLRWVLPTVFVILVNYIRALRLTQRKLMEVSASQNSKD
jgi:hypothetical protein